MDLSSCNEIVIKEIIQNLQIKGINIIYNAKYNRWDVTKKDNNKTITITIADIEQNLIYSNKYPDNIIGYKTKKEANDFFIKGLLDAIKNFENIQYV